MLSYICAPLVNHPDVVAFHRDHCIDRNTVLYWKLDWVATNEQTIAVAEESFQVQVTILLADAELRVTLDESLYRGHRTNPRFTSGM
ncbi:hypothetical protein DMJ13_18090 [halophilic archaeon]|nr:hypothetical protein DMJ13_18090 [halophilic archaeon]